MQIVGLGNKKGDFSYSLAIPQSHVHFPSSSLFRYYFRTRYFEKCMGGKVLFRTQASAAEAFSSGEMHRDGGKMKKLCGYMDFSVAFFSVSP